MACLDVFWDVFLSFFTHFSMLMNYIYNWALINKIKTSTKNLFPHRRDVRKQLISTDLLIHSCSMICCWIYIIDFVCTLSFRPLSFYSFMSDFFDRGIFYFFIFLKVFSYFYPMKVFFKIFVFRWIIFGNLDIVSA